MISIQICSFPTASTIDGVMPGSPASRVKSSGGNWLPIKAMVAGTASFIRG
jgi:hypothetical protein